MANDDSLKCDMCDTLGIAGPCKKHKADPFAGVLDEKDVEAFIEKIASDEKRGPRKWY